MLSALVCPSLAPQAARRTGRLGRKHSYHASHDSVVRAYCVTTHLSGGATHRQQAGPSQPARSPLRTGSRAFSGITLPFFRSKESADDDGSSTGSKLLRAPNGQQMDEKSWRVRIQQKAAFVKPAIEAARIGGPPPLPALKPHEVDVAALFNPDTPFETHKTPVRGLFADQSLFQFVRKRLLRIAEAELDEEKWTSGSTGDGSADDVSTGDLLPPESRIAWRCFAESIKPMLARKEVLSAGILLEDWLRFIPVRKFTYQPHDLEQQQRETARRLALACSNLLFQLAKNPNATEAEAHAAVELVERLFNASVEAQIHWNEERRSQAAHLCIRHDRIESACRMLAQQLERWWDIKLNVHMHEPRHLTSATESIKDLLSDFGNHFEARRQALLHGASYTARDSPEDREALRQYFHQLAQFASLFADAWCPPFYWKGAATGPYLKLLKILTNAQADAQKILGAEIWSSPSSGKHTGPMANTIGRHAVSIGEAMRSFLEHIFPTLKSDPPSEDVRKAERIALMRTLYQRMDIANVLLPFALRHLHDSSLALAIMKHVLQAGKAEAARQRKALQQADLGEVGSASAEASTGLHNVEHLIDYRTPTYTAIRHANTTLLDQSVLLRHFHLQEAALSIIIAEELGSAWFANLISSSNRGQSTDTTSTRDDWSDPGIPLVTPEDILLVLHTSLNELDLHRTVVVLRFLIANGFVVPHRAPTPGSPQPRSWSRFRALSISPIKGTDLLRLFLPSIHADLIRTGSLPRPDDLSTPFWSTIGGNAPAGDLSVTRTPRETTVLSNMNLCTTLLSAVVKSGTWQVVQPLWNAINNFASVRPVARRGSSATRAATLSQPRKRRIVSVGEATVIMQFLSETMRVMMQEAPEEGDGEVSTMAGGGSAGISAEHDKHLHTTKHGEHSPPASVLMTPRNARQLEGRTVEQCIEDVCAVRSQVQDEYNKVMQLWRDRHSHLDVTFAPVDARFFKEVLRASAWPSIILYLESERSNAYNNKRRQVFDALLVDKRSVDFLLEVLNDMVQYRIPIPIGYTNSVLPRLGAEVVPFVQGQSSGITHHPRIEKDRGAKISKPKARLWDIRRIERTDEPEIRRMKRRQRHKRWRRGMTVKTRQKEGHPQIEEDRGGQLSTTKSEGTREADIWRINRMRRDPKLCQKQKTLKRQRKLRKLKKAEDAFVRTQQMALSSLLSESLPKDQRGH